MSVGCVDDLGEMFRGAYGATGLKIQPEACPPGMKGDITVNCFRLAGETKRKPVELAAAAADFLSKHADVDSVEAVKAFVNITLKPAALHRDSLGDIAGLLAGASLPETTRKKILVEFSAPNTNKPLHLGHLRNNSLGMSLVAILKRIGHRVTSVNLINDRGIHICKSMVAYRLFGGGETPESTGVKGDHLVGKYYVIFDRELKRQLQDLRNSQPDLASASDDELFLKTAVGREAQEMLLKWEAADRDVRELWSLMNSWVLKGFEETYRRMGVTFDCTYYESETYLLGRDMIEEALGRGVFRRRPDGAVIAELGPKLGEKVVLRSDGTSVYITQDIGTTVKKYNDFSPDTQVWVVGDEQRFHFQILFAILKTLGYPWAANLHHLAYGMVNLPSGKMKSREGTVVDADDLFDELVALAKSATLERAGEDVPRDIDQRSEIIAFGALKFMLLKFNPKTTVMFDPEASVKFEGDTGPYIQYACARINSIARRAAAAGTGDSDGVNWALLESPHEKKLSVTALLYSAALQRAAELLDPSILAAFLLEFAKDFSSFYRECPVLNAPTPQLRQARLALCSAVGAILSDGLETLTIRVPEAM